MGYREDLEHCRAYIDEHLTEEITPRRLAEQFGYSFYHFCHMFRAVNGVSVGKYLREQRLSQAAAGLLADKSVTEAALEAGFDTPSGFTRAFCRRFNLSPNEYKKRKDCMIMLNPTFKKMPGFSAIGYILKPESEINFRENGAYWLGQDFSRVSKDDYAKLTYPGYAETGLWLHPNESGELCYFFGPQVKSKEFIPRGMSAIDLPEAKYAVFTVPRAADSKSLHDNVNQTWRFIFNDWFDKSGCKFDESKMDFEMYLGEEAFIYIPVL